MGATSVSGVSGPGSADNQKGAQSYSLGVERLVGPRVVDCGVQVLAGGTATVEIPTLSGVVGDYAIFLQGDSATVARPSAFTTSTFVITGGTTDTVYWQIVKKGLS